MSTINHADVKNSLLRALPAEDFAKVSPHLVPRELLLRDVVFEGGRPIPRLLFPETGFISVTAASDRLIEIGLIGPEGFAGAPVLLGSEEAPHRYVVQAPGDALALDVAVLPTLARDVPSFARIGLRFVHVFMVQIAQTAYVNGTYTIEARLARWLLMCQDRLGGEELALTHEFLSMMLGVQRTSVTLALQLAESNGLIRAKRGRVIIRDRERLIDLADDGYGIPEAEYARLFPDLQPAHA